MQVALNQITSGEDPLANLELVRGDLYHAAEQGTTFALGPEVAICLSNWRAVLSRKDEGSALGMTTWCDVLAKAEIGDHVMANCPMRRTLGPSKIPAPWGADLPDSGIEHGVRLAQHDTAHHRVPVLANARILAGPE